MNPWLFSRDCFRKLGYYLVCSLYFEFESIKSRRKGGYFGVVKSTNRAILYHIEWSPQKTTLFLHRFSTQDYYLRHATPFNWQRENLSHANQFLDSNTFWLRPVRSSTGYFWHIHGYMGIDRRSCLARGTLWVWWKEKAYHRKHTQSHSWSVWLWVWSHPGCSSWNTWLACRLLPFSDGCGSRVSRVTIKKCQRTWLAGDGSSG